MTTPFERAALSAAVAFVGLGIAGSLILPSASATLPPQAQLSLIPDSGIDSAVQPHKGHGLVPASIGFQGRAVISPDSTKSLRRTFQRIGYDLDAVRAGEAPVPRLYVETLPSDLKDVQDVQLRKRLFFKTVLPLVLKVNERIQRDRDRLWSIIARKRLGEAISARDKLWLAVMADRYDTDRGDTKTLLRRVDIIPPSLALAQAAEESGWGTSRFTREGNALYGQWTWGNNGLVPGDRADGKDHKVQAFDTVLRSVEAYAHNLNTHRAYHELRMRRAELRREGQPVVGTALADCLKHYSARGEDYVQTLDTIIQSNDLEAFDQVDLTAPPAAVADTTPTI